MVLESNGFICSHCPVPPGLSLPRAHARFASRSSTPASSCQWGATAWVATFWWLKSNGDISTSKDAQLSVIHTMVVHTVHVTLGLMMSTCNVHEGYSPSWISLDYHQWSLRQTNRTLATYMIRICCRYKHKIIHNDRRKCATSPHLFRLLSYL